MVRRLLFVCCLFDAFGVLIVDRFVRFLALWVLRVVGCLLLVLGCRLSVFGCWLFFVDCCLVFVGCWFSFVGC